MMKSYEYYDRIAYMYDEMYNNKKWLTLRKAVEHYMDKTINMKNARVLDIGSGTGYWLEYFLNKGFSVYALEPSSKMIEFAKERFKDKVKYFNTTIENFVTDNKFDILNIQGDVLSYVENLDLVMKKLSNIINKDGLLFATVDSYYYMRKLVKKYGNSREMEIFEKYHITTVGSQYGIFNSKCFTLEDIKELEKYGFQVLEIRGCGYSDNLEKEIEKSYNIVLGEHIYFSLRYLK